MHDPDTFYLVLHILLAFQAGPVVNLVSLASAADIHIASSYGNSLV